ncbi:aminotransferase class III-fold pyridoxal phosphate-dependent enzyme [Aquimarina sp. AU474]|uniref:aminotransferase class III-fold pyridoxal phosphate-dependent enzyme n=1 Tax=Aquimarina sp. AU474 TaxID=2108529 RepID=UPI000D69A54F|nr:aminotransferase class III-fold pyridoxal phosphate-dependent enzyme [Aquimarina sp. AU474]
MNKLIQNLFGLVDFEIKKLVGYDNINYLIKSENNKCIFKTYPYTQELLDLLKAETEILFAINKNDPSKFPIPIEFIDELTIKINTRDHKKSIYRALSFLDGTFIGNVESTKELFQSLGVFLAQMDIYLEKITNYTIQSRCWEWDIQYLLLNKKYINDIVNVKDRNTVLYFFQQFEENVTPVLHKLRKQIIHNDANEWNILVKNNTVSGIIDFGDLAYSPLVNELAVAITYGCYDKEKPLLWACYIIEAYHGVLPLEEIEIQTLYYLIAARLCISVCNSAHSKKINPDNAYASISEKNAWNMLHIWLTINPIEAENKFRSAIDLPLKQSQKVNKIIEKRYRYTSPILSLSYQEPIYMDRSAFQYMYDSYGNTFLDAYNNIPHVGHSHPKVVDAGQRQIAKLNTNTRYIYDLLTDYSEKLLSKFPNSLNKVYFVNSGSAATDLAIRMAKAHTKLKKVMVVEHGYHGNTQAAIDISDYKFNNPKGEGQKNHVLKTVIPDTYKGKYTTQDAGSKYANDAIELIKDSTDPIALFIAEPIVGCGGQVPLAKGYLKEIYPAIRNQGGVCISDEVQTGFGRLGDHYWGYEAQEVIPDIVIVGKPMANGHPMGAVICTDEIAESFGKGVEFFSSFGGNPVSCAIALSVIETIDHEKLQQNAKIVGDYYKSLFIKLQEKHVCIGDVRGSGLFLGIEIIKENTHEPNTALAQNIKNKLRHNHILISTDGPYNNVLKTKPPLCFTKENAKMVVDTIDYILELP